MCELCDLIPLDIYDLDVDDALADHGELVMNTTHDDYPSITWMLQTYGVRKTRREFKRFRRDSQRADNSR